MPVQVGKRYRTKQRRQRWSIYVAATALSFVTFAVGMVVTNSQVASASVRPLASITTVPTSTCALGQCGTGALASVRRHSRCFSPGWSFGKLRAFVAVLVRKRHRDFTWERIPGRVFLRLTIPLACTTPAWRARDRPRHLVERNAPASAGVFFGGNGHALLRWDQPTKQDVASAFRGTASRLEISC